MRGAVLPFDPPLAANLNEPGEFHDHRTETDAWLRCAERRALDEDRAGTPQDRIAGLILAFAASVAFWGAIAAVFLGVRS